MSENNYNLVQYNEKGSISYQIGGIDVLLTHNGLSCLLNDIEKFNMFVSVGEAKKIADKRKSNIDDKIINVFLNIAENLKDKLGEALHQPEIIKTIYKVQNSYVFEGNEKKVSLLLKLLKNRVFAEDLDKILIDDCIDIVSEITSKQIELIKFQYLQESSYKDFDSFSELEVFYKNRYRDISEDFLLLEPVDLEYLVYKKMLEKSGSKIIYWDDKKEFSMQDEKCRRNLEKSYPSLKPYMDKEIALKFDSYELTPLSSKLASFIIEDKAI